jgi:hypothetical protein
MLTKLNQIQLGLGTATARFVRDKRMRYLDTCLNVAHIPATKRELILVDYSDPVGLFVPSTLMGQPCRPAVGIRVPDDLRGGMFMCRLLAETLYSTN